MTPEWGAPWTLTDRRRLGAAVLKRWTKRLFMVSLPAGAFVLCVLLKPGTCGVIQFLGQDLVFGRVDQLSLHLCIFDPWGIRSSSG